MPLFIACYELKFNAFSITLLTPSGIFINESILAGIKNLDKRVPTISARAMRSNQIAQVTSLTPKYIPPTWFATKLSPRRPGRIAKPFLSGIPVIMSLDIRFFSRTPFCAESKSMYHQPTFPKSTTTSILAFLVPVLTLYLHGTIGGDYSNHSATRKTLIRRLRDVIAYFTFCWIVSLISWRLTIHWLGLLLPCMYAGAYAP